MVLCIAPHIPLSDVSLVTVVKLNKLFRQYHPPAIPSPSPLPARPCKRRMLLQRSQARDEVSRFARDALTRPAAELPPWRYVTFGMLAHLL